MNNPNKMQFQTQDLTAANIAKLNALFPNLVTEGKVNLDALRSFVGEEIWEREAYEFTWVGKREAIAEAGKPIRKTLRPDRESSFNFDTTENLYLEGDNLDVLKLLQESYLGKVKMIYIDPPYNTGNDFIYRDNFTQSREEYDEETGMYDEDGDRLFRNTESNGRFHSDWCSMIYPRLVLARNLLRDDGVIFISIDDNETAQLRKICDEVFGDGNFRNIIATRRYDKNLNRQFIDDGLVSMNVGLEFIFAYSKSIDFKFMPVFREASEERSTQGYWKGFWNNADRPTMRYDCLGVTPESGQWKWKKELAEEAISNYVEYANNHSDLSLEDYWLQTGKDKKFIRRNPSGKGMNRGVEHWVSPANGILRTSNWSD